MPDARDITQRIAGWLLAGAIPRDGRAAATADAYALLTRRAAERLNRCAALLAQGLRTEAVQEADAEPDLLGEIAALELPDASAWGDACRRNDWAHPEAIRPDVAALLNRAYADEALVEPLLREYRLRCVVRAPIRARLAALRALAGVDRANRPWHDALVELEQARHAEIRAEARNAMGDVEMLQELRRELRDDRQKLRPPADLVRLVDEALQDGRVARAQRRLEALLPALENAYSAMDFPACERLLDDWSQTLKAVGRSALQVPEPLRQRVEPIMQWVDRQAQAQAADLNFREACERLSEEARRTGPTSVLQSALDEAASYERPLPGTLADVAREALGRRRLAERRKRNLKAAGVAVATLLLLAGIGLWVGAQRTQRGIDHRLTAIREATVAGALAEAQAQFAAFADAYPTVSADLPAAEVRSRLDDAFARQRSDAEAFTRLSASLDATAVEDWEDATLEELSDLAREQTQRDVVAHKQAAFMAYQDEQARLVNAAALDVLSEGREVLGTLDGEAIDRDPQEARRAATEVRGRVDGLLKDQRLTASTAALLNALSQRAQRVTEATDAVSARRREVAEQQAARQALVAMSDQPASLAASLLRFAERYPEASMSASFVAAAELLPAWEAVQAWREIRGSWASPHPLSRVNAAERLRQIESYRGQFPASPWLSAINAYAGDWSAGLLASADDGPWKQRLPELMRAPAFRDLGVAETTDGRRFYVVGDADRRETSLGTSVRVALTPDLSRLTPMDFDRGVLGPVRLSPQAELANRLLRRLAAFEFETWDTFTVDVVETVYAADEVDAVLRGLLLGLMLESYEAATGPLDMALAALRSRLALHVDDTANWMNPQDLAAQRSREALREAFAQPVDFAAMRRALEQRRTALAAAVSHEVVGHGLLLAEEQGRPTLRVGDSLPAGARALYGVTNETTPAWRRIGVWDAAGVVTWLPDVAKVPAGSPVWLLDMGAEAVTDSSSGAGR